MAKKVVSKKATSKKNNTVRRDKRPNKKVPTKKLVSVSASRSYESNPDWYENWGPQKSEDDLYKKWGIPAVDDPELRKKLHLDEKLKLDPVIAEVASDLNEKIQRAKYKIAINPCLNKTIGLPNRNLDPGIAFKDCDLEFLEKLLDKNGEITSKNEESFLSKEDLDSIIANMQSATKSEDSPTKSYVEKDFNPISHIDELEEKVARAYKAKFKAEREYMIIERQYFDARGKLLY